MKVWTLSKGGPKVEVTDTGWISGTDVNFLDEVRGLFEQPLDEAGSFPLPGMPGYHILRIDPSGDNVIAVYCNWGYGIAEDLGGGKYGAHSPSTPPGYEAVAAIWLMLSPPPSGYLPLPPQKGPAPAPADDVFGGWRVTQRLPGLPGETRVPAEWPTMIDDVNTCVATAPDPPDRRLFLTHGTHPRSDFPALPPSPGWPAGNRQ